VHLIAVPESEESLRRALGEAHRRYTRGVNFRQGWRGHLWQGRFASFPMDEAHTLQAARYIELNPVEAGLVNRAREYRWSSAAAHGRGRDDALVRVKPLLEMVGRGQWGKFLAKPGGEEQGEVLRRHERTGRPLGGDDFLAHLESALSRELRPQKRGPKGPWKHKSKG
jgi:putative transposase